ncbi:MAG: tRNA preQ1(34) S-adenosylmethionine ribosyltransferase-isomerase QueA [Burkholderiales bacterium]|nr:tRNA preQ1(34) S-adenosylmethionine ribosyltransferase-isomerase QueA [Burkholderiales bacterium]
MPHAYTLEDFDFHLPEELIAQSPAPTRSGSRLLLPAVAAMRDHVFRDLPQFLQPGDLLVFNQTRVVKARLMGRKATGGRVEVMIERVLGPLLARVQLRASHAPHPGSVIELDGGARAVVKEHLDGFWLLRFSGCASVAALMEAHGTLPLPPYIEHAPSPEDLARYQTVYAASPGAVAAPTAGLHFDDALLDALRARGVERAFLTLHVGAGTFQPVRVRDIAAHRMHSEWYEIPAATADAITRARARSSRVIAVGTTCVRALESAALRAPGGSVIAAGSEDTAIFITPGFRFRVVDILITNFHLPKSTLMMLVAAFAGHDLIRAAYAHAIAARYRFFSYGDAMLLERAAR